MTFFGSRDLYMPPFDPAVVWAPLTFPFREQPGPALGQPRLLLGTEPAVCVARCRRHSCFLSWGGDFSRPHGQLICGRGGVCGASSLRAGAGVGQSSQKTAAPLTCLPRVLALSFPHLLSAWSQSLLLTLLVAPPGGLSMWPQIQGDGEVNSASPGTVAGNLQPPLMHCR